MQRQHDRDHLTGGRRIGLDRREYTYFSCIPERRTTGNRRRGEKRRRLGRLFSTMVAAADEAAAVSMVGT